MSSRYLISYILSGLLLGASAECEADVPFNAPGALNPVIPGYFADPTLKKFGDTYYMYATTDGSGAGFGPAQVWVSQNLRDWTLMPMNWPDSHWIWAPDVMQSEADGSYRYFYCQPCQIHEGVSDTPRGPWTNVLGESEAVLVPDRFVTNAITLDGQTFVDDDGSVYMYWGTWGIYEGFGCGAGRLADDLKSFTETRLIPNTEATDFFEAPFVLKRDGTYYFMYSSGSCHDHTYRVQYATSDRPLGPYTYRGCILETSADGTVHGPGHHSVVEIDGCHYIVYHRHDNPHSNRGFHRQLCIDRLEFADDGSIMPVTPTHSGVEILPAAEGVNLARCRPVRVSSAYDDNFRGEYAVDDNNGTLWRPAGMGQEWIEIDLGKKQDIATVWTQWEYGTQFYQYLIETSADGKKWEMFADKRQNRLAGSPMVDFGHAKARYVRITSTGGEKVGFNGALWNVKVFADLRTECPQQWIGLSAHDWNGRAWPNNHGQLGGELRLVAGHAESVEACGRKGVRLQPGSELTLTSPALSRLDACTFTAMVLTDGEWRQADLSDCLKDGKVTLSSGRQPLTLADVRLYNWPLSASERAYDATAGLRRNPVADRERLGRVVHIDAAGYATGDTVAYLPNKGAAGGWFEAVAAPVVVVEQKGRRGFAFDGTQTMVSTFGLPPTMRDNTPYTLEAWILNPEIAENECYADFTSSHDELEKIMAVNGTEPRCGVMNHYGWYEDAGWPQVAGLAGEWQHVYVCFDGRMERVYINGQLASEKDIQLLVKPSQFVTLGRNAEHEWPFSGLIGSLTLWDTYIPYTTD